ncbi:MAG: RHS repeat domain-containing protein, partial [Candidatus Methanofastidiosia archaeon]
MKRILVLGHELSHVEYPDQSMVTFTYDANGNRLSMIDSEGIATYAYDNRNRLITESRTIEGQQYAVHYGYNAVSQVTSITYPEESVITYEHDSLNRLSSIP